MLDPAQTVTGDHYTFVQNPNYWDKDRQHWKTVTVRVDHQPVLDDPGRCRPARSRPHWVTPTTLPAAEERRAAR